MGIQIKNIVCANGPKEGRDIYIEGTQIVGIDTMPDGFVAADTIDGTDKLLIPGLMNCHTHTYMSIFRNAADDLAFNDWLFGHISPLEDQMIATDAYWGSMLSMIEMIKSGTTCFCDMHMHPDQTARAVEESGLRAVITRGLVGSDRTDEGGIRRLAEAKSEMENWKNNSRMTFMLAPHAIYTCGEEYLKQIKEEAELLGVGLNIHLSESQKEFDDCMAARGCTPVKYLDKLGLLTPNTVAAHCVYLTEEDMRILAERGVNAAINPASNMKLGNGFAPVFQMQKAGINICIGTDGAASNNSLNLFHEMNLAALVYKGSEKNAQAVTAKDVLQFATENAAKALGFEGMLGKIETGYKADLTIIDRKNERFMPAINAVSALAYSVNGSEVDTVIVDGRILMKNKQLLTIDEERVYYNVNNIAKRLGIL